jgi:hypothetical protein
LGEGEAGAASSGAKCSSDHSTEDQTLVEVRRRRRSAQRSGVPCLRASGRRFDPGRAHSPTPTWAYRPERPVVLAAGWVRTDRIRRCAGDQGRRDNRAASTHPIAGSWLGSSDRSTEARSLTEVAGSAQPSRWSCSRSTRTRLHVRAVDTLAAWVQVPQVRSQHFPGADSVTEPGPARSPHASPGHPRPRGGGAGEARAAGPPRKSLCRDGSGSTRTEREVIHSSPRNGR